MQRSAGLFFLDGLDLLTSGSPEPAALIAAAMDSAEDDNHFFVFSSRPLHSVRDALREPGNYYRIDLIGLDQQAVDGLLAEHPKLRDTVNQICLANSATRTLRDIPLLFSMVLSVANATLGGDEPFKCDRYPGRAGLFAGFIDHFVERAKGQNRLDEDYNYSGRSLEKLCWAALTAGNMEAIPGKGLLALIDRVLTVHDEAEVPLTCDQFENQVSSSTKELRQAGIVLKAETDQTIHFIHQEFMEHLGGRYLARRLKAAKNNGWLDAELWDHLVFKRLDNLVAHALALLEDKFRLACMDRTFSMLSQYNLSERTSLLGFVDPANTIEILKPFLRDGNPYNRMMASREISRLKYSKPAWTPEPTIQLGDHKLSRCKTEEGWHAEQNTLDVGVFVESLQSKDVQTRKKAISSLGESRSHDAVMPLIGGLEDQDASVRSAAAHTLGTFKAPEAVKPLINSLKDPDQWVRRAAVFSLKSTKDSRALKSLMEALTDQSASVRHAAAWALGDFNAPQAGKPLIQALKDQDEYVRRAAAEALGKLNTKAAVKPLLEALKDIDDKVRGYAAIALGNIGASEAVQPLIEALFDKGDHLRWSAATALGELEALEAVEPLIDTLREKGGYLTDAAVTALGKIKDSRAVSLLVDVLLDQHQSDLVRFAAVNALEEIKDPRAVKPLIEVHKDCAGYAMLDIGDFALMALANIWKHISPDGPPHMLFENTHKISDSNSVFISTHWEQRWPGKANLGIIESQRLKRMTKEKTMSKIGDDINITVGSNVGQIIGKQVGTNYFNDPQVLFQALDTLRSALQDPNIFNSPTPDIDKVMDKLDEIITAVRSGAQPEAIKGPWNWLQDAVNIAALADYSLQAWQLLVNSLPK